MGCTNGIFLQALCTHRAEGLLPRSTSSAPSAKRAALSRSAILYHEILIKANYAKKSFPVTARPLSIQEGVLRKSFILIHGITIIKIHDQRTRTSEHLLRLGPNPKIVPENWKLLSLPFRLSGLQAVSVTQVCHTPKVSLITTIRSCFLKHDQ